LAKKETTEVIRSFKEDKSSCWYLLKHWKVMDGELILCAGGIFYQDDYDHVYKYFRTKKMIK